MRELTEVRDDILARIKDANLHGNTNLAEILTYALIKVQELLEKSK